MAKSKPTYKIVNNNHETEDLKFFTEIDAATKEWINHLEYVWRLWQECDGITTTLTEYFATAPNAYLSTLRVTVNISDFKNAKRKPSLTFTVIEEFAKWINPRKDLYQDFLVVDLKIVAFRLLVEQKSMELFQLFANTYEFLEHKEVFIPFIENMIAAKKFKEAAQYATVLKLQKHFQDVQVLLLPLILQNKLSIVDDFLGSSEPEIRESLVQYLDNLIASDVTMRRQLDEFISVYQVPDIKISITDRKPLSKLVARFVKLHNLSPTICKNVNKKRNEGALYFLIRKRYMDFSLSQASWREMANEAVQGDKHLQVELLKMLVNVKDAKEGLYWAKKLDIPKEQWPGPISYEAELMEMDEISGGASASSDLATSDWDSFDSSDNYHEFGLPRDCIAVVDNSEKFENFLDCGLKDVSIVGIDCEWKPNFGTKKTELAMIQIATNRKVYILDVTTMASTSKGLWTELAICLFENTNIIKLGFGIMHDLRMIKESLPVFTNVNVQRYIDIVDLWNKLVEHQFVFPHAYDRDDQFFNKNLSRLVELCFGKKLNKSDQFSNWEQRPLREGQLIYAALDAYCLLEIYNVFKTQCERLNIPFAQICLEVQRIPYKTAKKSTKTCAGKPHVPEVQKLKSRSYQDPRPPPSKPEAVIKMGNPTHSQFVKKKNISIRELRVVCDAKLGGLITKLRICGCDCIRASVDNAIDIACQDKRIFLTEYAHFQRLSQRLPRDQKYFVPPGTHELQFRKLISHFGVTIDHRDIYSRCKVCNNTEFAKVPKLILEQLFERYNRNKGVLVKCNYYFEESNSNMDSDIYKKIDDRRWTLNNNSIQLGTCATKYNVPIRMNELTVEFLNTERYFYVCEHCGKVMGLGRLLEQTLNFYKDFIVDT